MQSLLLPLILAAAIPSHEKILLIGDSEVVYSQIYFNQSQVKEPGETVFFDAWPGRTIGYMNYIFVREMNKFPDLDTVIIFLGTNNFNFTFLQPYNQILDEVKRRNLRCIWIGPTKVNGQHHAINDLIHKAVEPTCKYFDTEAADIQLVDGVHPTRTGAIKWLNLIWAMKATL